MDTGRGTSATLIQATAESKVGKLGVKAAANASCANWEASTGGIEGTGGLLAA